MKARPRKKPRPTAALVRLSATPERVVSEAEARLEKTIARLAKLDQEHTALGTALSEFSERFDERTAPAQDELFRAQRVDRKLEQVLEALRPELEAL